MGDNTIGQPRRSGQRTNLGNDGSHISRIQGQVMQMVARYYFMRLVYMTLTDKSSYHFCPHFWHTGGYV